MEEVASLTAVEPHVEPNQYLSELTQKIVNILIKQFNYQDELTCKEIQTLEEFEVELLYIELGEERIREPSSNNKAEQKNLIKAYTRALLISKNIGIKAKDFVNGVRELFENLRQKQEIEGADLQSWASVFTEISKIFKEE